MMARLIRGLALSLVLAAATMAHAELLLDADFESEPVDQEIGLGGAGLGQPASLTPTLTAIVRAGIMPSRSLEIAWDDGSGPSVSTLRFEFLDDIEVNNGELVIEFEVQPEIVSGYIIGLRENGSATRIFGEILLLGNGMIRAGDLSTIVTPLTYGAGELLNVRWVHDMSARTHSLWIKDTEIFAARPHAYMDRGVGSILFSLFANSADETKLHIDNVKVTWTPDVLFQDRFESDDIQLDSP